MHVVVLSHLYPTQRDPMKGVFVYDQVEALAASGVGIQVFSPRKWLPSLIAPRHKQWRDHNIRPKPLPGQVAVNYVPVAPMPGNGALTVRFTTQALIRHAVRCHQQGKCDLIHAHTVLVDGQVAARLAAMLKVPFVVTIHGSDLNVHAAQNTGQSAKIAGVLERAGAVMTVGKALADKATAMVSDPGKVVVVPNGTHFDQVMPAPDTELADIFSGRFVVAAVGSLVPTKGYDLLLSAAAGVRNVIPNLAVVIAGDGVERERLETMVRDLGLSDCVHFLGQLPRSEVFRYLSIADVFALPSWSEGFGIVYLEALAHGLPVIACQGQGPSDFVEHGVHGFLVEPRAVAPVTDALVYLHHNPEVAVAMGQAGRERVMSTYTWTKNAEQVYEIYRQVLARHSSGRLPETKRMEVAC